MFLLEVKNLVKHFQTKASLFNKKNVTAVNDVSFTIQRGETLGLVGESGCGKSTLGLTLLRLIEPTSGQILFKGNDIAKLTHSELRESRKKMQMIFQDPYSSLNPRMKIKDIVSEPLIVHNVLATNQMLDKTKELLDLVGMSESSLDKYPHEFSGGQRQRIGIARAVALNPEFIVADEAVSALDVSIRGGVLNLLSELKSKMNLSYLFISHDLSVVEYISDRIAVMYLGKIVEFLPKSDFEMAKHPYTKALYASMPSVFSKSIEDPSLKGDLPFMISPPNGCIFHPRCKYAMNKCKLNQPNLEIVENGHLVACFLSSDNK